MSILKSSSLSGRTLITGVFVFTVVALLTPYKAFQPDIECWKQWAFQIKLNGLCLAYDAQIVYMPGFLYILYLYDLFFQVPTAVMEHIHLVKIITLFFDFAAALLVVSMVKNVKSQIWMLLVLVLNPGYLYNTVLWGQVDAIYTAFVVAAVITAIHQKIFFSTLLVLLAVNMKFQGIIYYPILFLLWLPFIKKQPLSWLMKLFGANLLLQFVLLIPFFIGTGFVQTIHHLYSVVVNHSPVVSQSAYNIWIFLKDGVLYQQSDQGKIYSLTFLVWGNIFFISGLILSLFPVFQLLRMKKTTTSDSTSLSIIFLACALTSLVFFYFKTGMHERYVHPSLIFLAAYAFISRDFIPFIVNSIAYFLQMEIILQFFHLNYRWPIFNKEFISLLFLILIVYSLVKMYWKVNAIKKLSTQT